MTKISDTKKPARSGPGRPALPPEKKRSARLSMRTYTEIEEKARRVGTEAVEEAIRKIKEKPSTD
jgi:hypothetical protein